MKSTTVQTSPTSLATICSTETSPSLPTKICRSDPHLSPGSRREKFLTQSESGFNHEYRW